MTNLKQDLARYGEMDNKARNSFSGNEFECASIRAKQAMSSHVNDVYHSFSQAMQLITVMQEALKHYTQVCSSVNDPNDFTPKIKDEGIYARNALSQAAKMGVE